MNKPNFRKASIICLALTMSCFHTQSLTALSILAEEEIALDEDESKSEVTDELLLDEESDEKEIVEEEIVLEDSEEPDVDLDKVLAEDKEASTDDLDTAACLDGKGGIPDQLTGSVSERLSQLENLYPEGHILPFDDFYFAKYCFACLWDWDKEIEDLAYFRPSSITDIAIGDFVQVYTSNKKLFSIVVTSINTESNTITGGGLNRSGDKRVSWKNTFDFHAVDYVISPDNLNDLTPGKDVDPAWFHNNSSSSEDDNADFWLDLNNDQSYSRALFANKSKYADHFDGYWGEMIYLSPNLVRLPGYRLSGWKMSGKNSKYLKYDEYKSLGEKIGVGKATPDGIKLSYSIDSEGDIVFEPGNAFWTDESLGHIPDPDSPTEDEDYQYGGILFRPIFEYIKLTPVWEVDPDYKLPAPSSQIENLGNPFYDIREGNWYYDWVLKANAAGLMTGLTSDCFGPNDKMSRAMVATVLYRMAGSPVMAETEIEQIFPDVSNGGWYGTAVRWAYENKIITGYDNGKFGPDDNITREQLATMICRYQRNVAGKSISARASLDAFPDKNHVYSYAKASVQYCVAKGIITGSQGHLLPRDDATRAECAKMLLVARDTD